MPDRTVSLESWRNDVRHGLRVLAKSRGFTAVAILSLAIGIGANSAIFSVTNALLIRPLPYPHADRIAILWQRSPGLNVPQDWFSLGQYLDIKTENTVFERVAAGIGASFNMTGQRPPRAHRRRACLIVALSDLRRARRIGPSVFRRRRSAGEDAVGDSHARILAATLRRRSLDRGQDAHAQRQQPHRHRRDVGGLLVQQGDHAGGERDSARRSAAAVAVAGQRAVEARRGGLQRLRFAQARRLRRTRADRDGRNREPHEAAVSSQLSAERRTDDQRRSAHQPSRRRRSTRPLRAARRRGLRAVDRLWQRCEPAAVPRARFARRRWRFAPPWAPIARVFCGNC